VASTPIRNIRTTDEVWENAQAVAAHFDTTVSALVQDFLAAKVPWKKITVKTGKRRDGEPRIMRPPSPGTRVRAFRCSQEAWDAGRVAAHANGTTVSTLVVDYLEKLRKSRDPRAPETKRQAPIAPGPPRPPRGRKRAVTHKRVDPEQCDHPPALRNKVMDLEFCRLCGAKLKGKVKL
jgi:hypothetical protein